MHWEDQAKILFAVNKTETAKYYVRWNVKRALEERYKKTIPLDVLESEAKRLCESMQKEIQELLGNSSSPGVSVNRDSEESYYSCGSDKLEQRADTAKFVAVSSNLPTPPRSNFLESHFFRN